MLHLTLVALEGTENETVSLCQPLLMFGSVVPISASETVSTVLPSGSQYVASSCAPYGTFASLGTIFSVLTQAEKVYVVPALNCPEFNV